jgi:hypothetical protein
MSNMSRGRGCSPPGARVATFLTIALVLPIAGANRTETLAPPQEVSLIQDFDRLGLAPLAQGDRPTCSLFAVTALVDFEWLRANPGSCAGLSEEFLLWATNDASGAPGDQAMFFEAVHGLSARGICRSELMPYAPTSDKMRRPTEEAIRDGAERAARWRVHWIKRWDVRRPLTSAQIVEIKHALNDGHPVACGFRWPKEFSCGKLLEPPDAEGVRDGHSIAFVGYRDDPDRPGGGVLQFRNSFGLRWGDRGYGTMSYAYARAYANDAFWLELGSAGSERSVASFEAEEMMVIARESCEAWPQAMNQWKASLWSGGKQLFCKSKATGFVELGFTVQTSGDYRVRVLATAAPDHGRVRVALDAEAGGPVFDLYSGRVSPAGSLELGTRRLLAGRHSVRFTAARGNAVLAGTYFGMDRVDLLKRSR